MHVVLSLGTGGTERLVIELSKSLRDEMRVSVCCLDELGEWADELREIGIEVFALHREPGFRPELARRVAQHARRRRIDILHCHQYSPFVYGALASLLLPKVRLIYTEHGRQSDALPSRKRRMANGVLSRIPGSFIAVSSELRHHMIAAGFPGRKVEVIRNGIDPGPRLTEEGRRAVRTELGLEPDAFVVGTVARLDPVKDLVTLVKAFRRVSATVPMSHLVVIGDGPERQRMEAVIENAGLEDRVVFTGMRDDARTLIQAFDLYVNTSATEGISLTILEAMAAGLPVVATRVGGTPEVVEDGATGHLFPARDPDAVAKAVTDLALAPIRRDQMGEGGRQRVEGEFSIARMAAAYLEAYREDALTWESR